MTSRTSLLVSLLSMSALASCSCGDDGPAVPFGLDAGGARVEAAPRDDEPAPAARPREEGRAFPEGTRRVDLEGAPILVEGSIRALWAHDVDGDGDRDGVLITSGAPVAPVTVLYSQREGPTFVAPRPLASAPEAPEGCVVTTASLSPLGDRWLIARAALACEAHPAAAREELFILGVERTPRVLERLAVLAEPERAPGEVTLALRAEDQDDDDHEDLVLGVSIAGAELPLVWLDRTSGLARDAAEPERTLEARSREALRQLRAAPAEALAGSRAVLSAWEVLCRESGRARLRVGGTDGLGCGRSEGAGRAATTIVRALATTGDLLGALDALTMLDRDGLAIDDERRTYARRAIAEAPGTAGVSVREGPAHTAPRGEVARLSALAFVDEDHVLLRGRPERVWDLATGEVTPTERSESDLRLLDPSGAYAVTGVERRCDGHVLVIAAQASVVGGAVYGAPHALPLLMERAPPAGAPCPDLTPALRADDGGWRLLGWAPQGVVAARGTELRVVPLDLSAQPTGAPELLRRGTPPPAPLPSGTVTSDGRFLAELRGLGVLVHRVTGAPETVVLWPAGWADADSRPTDPAVSPSGRRVAVLRDGHVQLLERSAP